MKQDLSVKITIKALSESRLVTVSVYMMMLSFFYNLPVMTYSAKGSNELRLYDFAGFIIMVLYFRNIDIVNALIRSKKTLKSLFVFLQWASFTFLFTIASSIFSNKLFWTMQSLLYLFHFWSFFIGAVFLILVIQDMRQLKKITVFSLICASITFLIVLLQNFAVIPFLWNEAYYNNYFGFLSGTLGPNKIVLGMTCLIMFAFGMGLLNDKRVKINKILLLTTVGLSALVLIMSGSRTSYLGLVVFLAYFLIRETKSFVYSGIVVFILILGLSAINTEVIDKAVNVYEGRVEDKIRNPNELQEGKFDELYEDLGSGRKGLSLLYIDLLIEDLLYVPFGKGFNNRLETMSSAHNTYLSLIYEVGIFGVILYFRWLLTYMTVKMPHFPQMRMALKGLVLSMLITLFFGEHLYVYRPLFGLLGLFLFITTLLSSPIFILENEDK